MLQSGIKFEVREKKSYPPLPEDVYQVELFDIEMEEVPDMNNKGEFQQVLKFQFVVVDEGEFRGRSIWKNYVPTYLWSSNNDKNALYQITKAMVMRDLNEIEIKNFDSDYINKLIGFQLRVGTVNKNGKGQNAEKVYSNIDKFLTKKMSLPALTEEEKEKARVKVEKSESVTEKDMPTPKVTEIDKDDFIPTIGVDEIKIDEVPF